MLKYIGDGTFFPGIPAKDLSAGEAEQCGGAETLLSSGLYIDAADLPEAAVKADAATDDEAIVAAETDDTETADEMIVDEERSTKRRR